MGFYWSYTLLFEPPVLVYSSCADGPQTALYIRVLAHVDEGMHMH